MRAMADDQGKKPNKALVVSLLLVVAILCVVAARAVVDAWITVDQVSGGRSTAESGGSSSLPVSSTPAQSAPSVPEVLLDVPGSGTKQTQKFTTSGDRTLVWSYDCTGYYGGTGNFQVPVYNDDGSLDSN